MKGYINLEVDVTERELRGAVEYVILPLNRDLSEICLHSDGCEIVDCYVNQHMAKYALQRRVRGNIRKCEEKIYSGHVSAIPLAAGNTAFLSSSLLWIAENVDPQHAVASI